MLLLIPSTIIAGPTNALLDAEAYAHYLDALKYINLTADDARFARDVAEPRLVLPRVRTMLRDPLELTVLGSEIQDSAGGIQALLKAAAKLLDVKMLPSTDDRDAATLEDEHLDASLLEALGPLYAALDAAIGRVRKSRSALSDDEMSYVGASLLGGVFNIEDHQNARDAHLDAGFDAALLERVIAENNLLDPKPTTQSYLDLIERVELGPLIGAANAAVEALEAFEAAVANVDWPAERVDMATPLGRLVIGSPGNDLYTNACFLIIDPAGDDAYGGSAASANGLQGRPLNVVLDLAGNDRYVDDVLIGPGTALFGVQVTRDHLGNDLYESAYAGQAAGICGVALLEDMSGRDVYRAHAFAQGAGHAGVGILYDRDGEDLYDVGFFGQAYAGVLGIGFLADQHGNDRYISGGRLPNFDNHDWRFNCFSQGFAMGMRPFAGGGVAALIDMAGSDTYQADIFGQGTAYWYGAGLLLDRAGDDTYNVYHYGQGSGIHLALGLLADGGGDDFYTGYILSQGNAHDYAVGILTDASGTDTYSADHHSQGRAIFNSFAMLLDRGGNDAYFARQSDKCQGAGHDGDHRAYGSMALLLDLGGRDHYSCGAKDGATLRRDEYGILWDVVDP